MGFAALNPSQLFLTKQRVQTVDFVSGPISQREVYRHDVEWLHTVIQLKEVSTAGLFGSVDRNIDIHSRAASGFSEAGGNRRRR